MLMDFLFADWQGTLMLVAGGFFVGLAAFYVRSPAKAYVVSALLIGTTITKVYSLGYTDADEKGKAALVALTDHYNLESEKAVVAAVARAREEASANMATLKRVMEAQVLQSAANESSYKQMLEDITKAGADADLAAPSLILEAIGRKRAKK